MAETKALSNGSDGQFVFKPELQGIRQIKAVTEEALQSVPTRSAFAEDDYLLSKLSG
jgi:hypothetical protein